MAGSTRWFEDFAPSSPLMPRLSIRFTAIMNPTHPCLRAISPARQWHRRLRGVLVDHRLQQRAHRWSGQHWLSHSDAAGLLTRWPRCTETALTSLPSAPSASSELWLPGETDFTGEVTPSSASTENCGLAAFFGHTTATAAVNRWTIDTVGQRGQRRALTAGDDQQADYDELPSPDQYGFVVLR